MKTVAIQYRRPISTEMLHLLSATGSCLSGKLPMACDPSCDQLMKLATKACGNILKLQVCLVSLDIYGYIVGLWRFTNLDAM